ncbi:hypothetical protein BKG86_19795 [Mycobacteroides chelonae]|nr:hypothetical protein BKG86_19795 [Mycobacteroides chelonae]
MSFQFGQTMSHWMLRPLGYFSGLSELSMGNPAASSSHLRRISSALVPHWRQLGQPAILLLIAATADACQECPAMSFHQNTSRLVGRTSVG